MPESQKKELFSAGITYMVSGEYAFAFSCFTQAGKSDLPTLSLSASTVVRRRGYREHPPAWDNRQGFFRIPSGGRLPAGFPADVPLTVAAASPLPTAGNGSHYTEKGSSSITPCCKVSARLHLHTEVRTIHARLGNKYQHIEELIKNIQP